MEKNIYPFDPDVLSSSTEFAKKLGTLMIEWSLDELNTKKIGEIAFVNSIKVSNLDPQLVYNWIFQGVADVLRKPEVRKEIEQAIVDAKRSAW
jgi:hypothetical protein